MEAVSHHEKRSVILKKLFISTFYLSAFTFGGGYVIVTLMKKTFVDQYRWIDEEEMLDLVAIAQSCPGAIAVNGAIVVGYKLAGLPGVMTSVLATVIPPLCHPFSDFTLLCRLPLQSVCGLDVKRNAGRSRSRNHGGSLGNVLWHYKRKADSSPSCHGRGLYCQLLLRRQRHYHYPAVHRPWYRHYLKP